MKLVTQLYIDTSGNPTGTPTYERVELFDFESIELTSTIQEIRDIGSVFTDFSQSFSVPASQNNNRVLKHYYNTELFESFDARIKQRGLIVINGITFREGYVRLSESTLKNGKPSTYELTFFGELVNLKQALGDDELKDLVGLNKYSHPYNVDVVYSGFIDGLGLIGEDMVQSSNRDIIYPSISASNRWYYDSSGVEPEPQLFNQVPSVNLYAQGAIENNAGIDYTQLKPAIKLKNIINSIQETYQSQGVVFRYDEDDFFNDVEFNQLYLLLHNVKGTLTTSTDSTVEQSRTYAVGTGDADSPFSIDSGEQELRPIKTIYAVGQGGETTRFYTLEIEILPQSPASNINYTIELLEGETVIDSFVGATGNYSLITKLYPKFETNDYSKTWNNLSYRIKSNGGLDTFDVNFNITRDEEYEGYSTGSGTITIDSTYTLLGNSTQSMITEINVTKHMPKIKTYDFLKGLFNMFNLTAYVENGLIIVKTLDKFYEAGNTIDLSDQIDVKDISIKRMNLYSNINFEFSKPKTFGIINQNEVNQDDFGNEKYEGSNNNLIFDGTKYNIKLPFEKLFFDRLSDEETNGLTDFGNGWLVDKDQNETITAPVLFFNKNTSINSSQYFGFKNKTNQIEYYNRPSNSSNNELSSIHFGAENDEYELNGQNQSIKITNSLFELHYKNYITNIFGKNSRMYNFTSFLKLSTLLKYNMNDKIIINDKRFVINSIRTDLNTGKSDLELITDFDIVTIQPPDTEAPTTPTDVTFVSATDSKIRFSWTESTDNIAVTGYEVWIDGSFSERIGIGSLHTSANLNANTSYSIRLLAFDARNNKSALSNAVSMSTLPLADTTPPTAPTNLTLGIVFSDSVGLSWGASTDNVGVNGYRIYVNGVYNKTETDLFTVVTGLSSQTNYSFYVTAIDAQLNESLISNTVIATTL
jgi:chitodextrinase